MGALSPSHWAGALKREWLLYHLADPEFRFMFDPPPAGEWVSLDCETTGLSVRTDEIVSIGAVRIVGDRIMTSERLELLVRPERGVSASGGAAGPRADARGRRNQSERATDDQRRDRDDCRQRHRHAA
jgi:hypothetical protein